MQTTYETAPDVGVVGMTKPDPEVKAMFSGEASAAIPFGFAAKRGSATDGRNAKLITATGDKVVGIVMHSQAYENGPNGDLNTTGVLPGGNLNMLREGYIFVKCEDGCAPGDRLWVRASGGTGAGTLRSTDAGSSTCIDCTAIGEWQDYAAAAAGAWLFVDFGNKQ